MLITEYRIPLPLSVDEYRVAQLYMIAKKSAEETSGAGSGVEILVNEPYVDGPGGQGQYTHKIYHIGQHLPGWLKALVPKSAVVEEEAWNAYPFTKTRYTCPFMEKFSIDIETRYFDDPGHQENVFNLPSSDLKSRVVDLIDIVQDQLLSNEYKEEEDPTIFVSQKTGRGPLTEDWIEDHWEAMKKGPTTSISDKRIMCAYKLVRVEFKYWGMQSKIEKYIHEAPLRKTMLRAHRQAWAWQDEWFGLTMDDIRRLEREIQEQLARKMAAINDPNSCKDNQGSIESGSNNVNTSNTGNNSNSSNSNTMETSHSSQEVNLDVIDKDKDDEIKKLSIEIPRNKSPSPISQQQQSKSKDQISEQHYQDSQRKLSLRKSSRTGIHSPGELSNQSFDVQIANWRMGSIANEEGESSSNEEFYDAQEMLERESLSKWSSLEFSPPDDPNESGTMIKDHQDASGTEDSIFSSSFIHKTQLEHSRKHISSIMTCGSMDHSTPTSPTASPSHHIHHHHPLTSTSSIHSHHHHHQHTTSHTVVNTSSTSFLIIVIHGGNILESGAEPISSKKSDFTTFRGAFESVIRSHYPSLTGKIAFRLVIAPAVCADALAVLSSLSPYSFQSSPSAIDGICHSYEAVPFGSLPLFAISSQEYQENVSKVINSANSVYQEFLKSEEGIGFSGGIILIGDSIGSVIGFDALCRSSLNNNATCSFNGSDNSIADCGGENNSTTSGGPSRPKSTSPANLALRQNPLISISDGSGLEDCDDSNNAIKCDSCRPASSSSTSAPPPSPLSPSSTTFTTPVTTTNTHTTGVATTNRRGKMFKNRSQDSFNNNHEDNVHLYLKLLSAPESRRRSSGDSSDQSYSHKFEFDVSDFFMFGSPLSLVLTFRKMLYLEDKNSMFAKPNCTQLYNLFHPMDPTVLRIEPLLSARFSHIPPINVPKYSKFPLGDGQNVFLSDCINHNAHVFTNSSLTIGQHSSYPRRVSDISVASDGFNDILTTPLVQQINQKWWGNKRLDYALYCPEGLTNFPIHSLPYLFHASFWESNDAIAFILRQLVRTDLLPLSEPEKEFAPFVPNQGKEKWIRKRTSIKIKNITANHRANDVIVKEGAGQIIAARFMYGPLDVVTLTGEKVDIHMMKDLTLGEWTYLSTETTDKTGRICYSIPMEKALGFGIYPFKLIVRGDHTSIDFFLAVVPPKTEVVVFSIDGSFTASVSVTGRDPKVRAGAVDVVRHWQELGYLIIYITGRPDMQQQRVISWLSQHNFPFGLVSFADRLSTDPLKHKAEYLKNLQQESEVVIHAAYGSSKDIWVYQQIGLRQDQIYIVGKVSKKYQTNARILSEGYAAHLAELVVPGACRPAIGNARMVLPRGCLGMGTYPGLGGIRSRKSAKKTSSYPLVFNSGNRCGGRNGSGQGNSSPGTVSSAHEPGPFTSFFGTRGGSNKSK